MFTRRVVLVIGTAALATMLAAACNDETPHFGQAGGLRNAPPPADDVPIDSGGGGDTGGGGCAPAIDAAACPTFTKDISPLMAGTGAWGCANSGCHKVGENAPKITGTADTDYATLSGYTQAGANKPFINPNSNALGDNGFACDLADPNVTKCYTGVAMPSGKTVQPAEFTLLENWIKCCSPK